MDNTDFKVQAVAPVTNTGGIEIMIDKSNTIVFYRWNYGQDLTNEPIEQAEIEYDESGNAGFKVNGEVWSLDQFMKV